MLSALQGLVERDSNGDMPNLSFYRNEIRFLPNGAWRHCRPLGPAGCPLSPLPATRSWVLPLGPAGCPLSLLPLHLLGSGLLGLAVGQLLVERLAFMQPHSAPWSLLRGCQGPNLWLGPGGQTCCD